MSDLRELRADIERLKDPNKGKFLQRYFKTGKGEYAEGDIFWGLTVPQSRIIAKKFKNIELNDVKKLLRSKIHEERLIALLILVDKFKKANYDTKKEIFDFYLANTKFINNWDLVDSSADKIIGQWLVSCHAELDSASTPKGGRTPKPTSQRGKQVRDDMILEKLANSNSIWERRIAIIATFAFIKSGSFKETLKIAEILLYDKEDLIHKAVGWMLREGGERVSINDEENFLRKYYMKMPRTMLRYAIEKFPEEKRKAYLLGTII